ncbi:MAG: cytochrome b, partial [Alphaproteobacteria bacterium]|nr:cytochrome b [Alphaproteobacteria bacterium]
MTAHAYTPLAKLLHWLTAAAIITVVPLGIAMVNAAPGA